MCIHVCVGIYMCVHVCVTIWKSEIDIGAFLSPPWFLRHESGDLFSQPPQNWDDRHAHALQPAFYMRAEDPSAGPHAYMVLLF